MSAEHIRVRQCRLIDSWICQPTWDDLNLSAQINLQFAQPSLSEEKATEVNGYLKQLCIEKNIFLIDHTKTIHSRNINRSKLHLIKSGSIILSNNFVKAIPSILRLYKTDGNNNELNSMCINWLSPIWILTL